MEFSRIKRRRRLWILPALIVGACIWLILCISLGSSSVIIRELRLLILTEALKNHYPEQNDFIQYHTLNDLPTIYAITPTYARPTQKADLTRLSQTLMQVPNFHWIVVEDSSYKTPLVTNLLKVSKINYSHLNKATNPRYKFDVHHPDYRIPRGVDQRNCGLQWIRDNLSRNTLGVVYFMDDDNTYSLQLFEEMRLTKKASVWPVGLAGGLKFEGPNCENDKVVSWHTMFDPSRRFPVDMAAFAVSVKMVLEHPNAGFHYGISRGNLESHFLMSLDLMQDDLEAKANNCTKILVWHTQTVNPPLYKEKELIRNRKPSNPLVEV